ncbi:SNF2 family N-terminal domain-containing protein [Spinellus fusiger]|nr:SNF2 family N-terminal domain-containing protein [Spinellus fusiger]
MKQAQQLQQLQQQSQSPSMDLSGSIPVPGPHSVFTQSQLAALKYQILAYKHISKNLPLPPSLQQAVLSPASIDNVPKELTALQRSQDISIQASPVILESPALSSTLKSAPSPAKKLEYNAYASPYNLLKKPIPSYAHASRQQRLLIPSITPVGMDGQLLVEERELTVKKRIQYQIDFLENKLGPVQKRIETLTREIQSSRAQRPNLKAMIELKALKLAEKQRKLREEMTGGMARSTLLAVSADRIAYRRMKKISLRDARMTEKIERQQRIDREQRERQKHMDYLQTICDHGRDMVVAHKTWQARQYKLGRAVFQFHQHIEKEEQKKAERITKERIRALKNDDEEAYMKLIDEAKDTRLTQLLKQTGAFLTSLTKAVVDQQNDSINKHGFVQQGEEEEEEGAVDPETKVDYFQVTHKVKEEVCQPTMLVGGTLKEYQVKGLQWMVSLYNNHLNGILADEMGLGKTIQTISLITYLIERKKQNGPFLIIVPLSTLTNWHLEFDKWAPSVSKIVYKGMPPIRRNLQMDIRRGDFQVLLTTFEYIIKDRPALSKVKWLHMIVDEGHRMKNTNSKLTLTLRQYYHTRYRLILTGTPLQNNLPELWALLNFILPKIFKSVKSFEEWFNTPFSTQGVQDKIDLNEEEQLLIIKRLHKVLRPFLLRRLKKDVESELPDKVEHVIKCKFSALQAKLYSQMKKNGTMYKASQEGKAGIKGLSNTLMQLRKICNHPFVFEEIENTINPIRQSNELLYRTSGKFELLDRMLPKLRQTGHRVLIFFQMTRIMSIMEDFMNLRGFPYLRLDGSTKSDDRSRLLQLFNAPDSPYFIFLLSTRAGGLGLNLQTADTVVIFDSDWNPHQDLQAQDRAHRIGQTKEVRIFRLICANSVEENILARANYKLDIDGKVIQAGKFDNRSTDEDREAFLRSLLEDKTDEDPDLEQDEEMDDEELNDMLKRSDQELVIFKKIDAERTRAETDLHRKMGGRGKKPERLIQEDELPDIYNQEEELMREDINGLLEYGRGQRVKESIRYDDGLTEEQWVEALEDENVDMDDLISQEEAKKRMGMSNPMAYNDDLTEAGSRRGRRKLAAQMARFDELDGVPKKRGRPKKWEPEVKQKKTKKGSELTGRDVLPPHIRQEMTEIFGECYNAVEQATEEDEHTYRRRCALFMDLVSKRDYPLYYTMIKTPIAMKMIKKRIHSPYYKSIHHFRADFHLMFDNARTFNEEGSIVYQDADEMQKILDKKLNSLCPGNVLPMSHTMPIHQAPPKPAPKPLSEEWNTKPKSRQPHTDEFEEEEEEEGDDEYEDDEYDE